VKPKKKRIEIRKGGRASENRDSKWATGNIIDIRATTDLILACSAAQG
jgi:hypothetical protein